MKIAVIGLGYVGLPLSLRLSRLNYEVLGIDINEDKIRKLQKGVLPFGQDEPLLKDYFKKENIRHKLSYSSKFDQILNMDIIFINVDTPIKNKKPNYKSLLGALKSISPNLKKGVIVIIESTVSPKTSDKLVIPTIEKYSNLIVNKDFYVAAVPERIRPNHIFEQLTTLPRVIGVSDKAIIPKLKTIYSKITSGEIDFTNLATAETVKTVENSLRDINIAFSNEVAMACEELGVNIWDVIKLVNKSPFHNMHKPGAGVGGHCIPKDPWLLVASVKKRNMRLIKTSRLINDSMPAHVYELIQKCFRDKKKNIKTARLVILGYAYVENTDDTRNSPTKALVEILQKKQIKYKIHDPFVAEYSKNILDTLLYGADCLILMVSHKSYINIDLKKAGKLMRSKIVIDCRNIINKQKAEALGFVYSGIGNIN